MSGGKIENPELFKRVRGCMSCDMRVQATRPSASIKDAWHVGDWGRMKSRGRGKRSVCILTHRDRRKRRAKKGLPYSDPLNDKSTLASFVRVRPIHDLG